jgi:NADH-quinone oxidoreductase subunit G
MERVAEFGIYASDPVVRRSPALARTADGKAARAARMNAATMGLLGVAEGGQGARAPGRRRSGPSRDARQGAARQHGAHRARRRGNGCAGGEGDITLERVRETAVA